MSFSCKVDNLPVRMESGDAIMTMHSLDVLRIASS